VLSVAELLVAPQYVAREVIVEQHHPVAGAVRQPGPSIRYSATPWSLRTPAPLLGQHNDEVLGPLSLGEPAIAEATGRPAASMLAAAGGPQ
jgi:CoA:oxalate CoA-transferase